MLGVVKVKHFSFLLNREWAIKGFYNISRREVCSFYFCSPQIGAVERNGAFVFSLYKLRLSKVGLPEFSVIEFCINELGLLKVGIPKDCVFEVCCVQICLLKIRIFKISIASFALHEVGFKQECPTKVCSLQRRLTQIDLKKFCASKVDVVERLSLKLGSAEFWNYVRILIPPFIPLIYPRFQNFEMLRICHNLGPVVDAQRLY